MTVEQLDTANTYIERINRLKKVYELIKVKAIDMDPVLTRHTSFEIIGPNDFRQIINQGELMMLMEAYGNEISRLEYEFAGL